jgi:hypothetical protein
MTGVLVRPATVADLSAVTDLMMAQEVRQCANSTSRLAIHARQQIEAALADLWHKDEQSLVALDRDGKVCAYRSFRTGIVVPRTIHPFRT